MKGLGWRNPTAKLTGERQSQMGGRPQHPCVLGEKGTHIRAKKCGEMKGIECAQLNIGVQFSQQVRGILNQRVANWDELNVACLDVPFKFLPNCCARFVGNRPPGYLAYYRGAKLAVEQPGRDQRRALRNDLASVRVWFLDVELNQDGGVDVHGVNSRCLAPPE